MHFIDWNSMKNIHTSNVKSTITFDSTQGLNMRCKVAKLFQELPCVLIYTGRRFASATFYVVWRSIHVFGFRLESTPIVGPLTSHGNTKLLTI
jgi:hypothetical protein